MSSSSRSKELAKLLSSGSDPFQSCEGYSTDVMLDELCGPTSDGDGSTSLADLDGIFKSAIETLQAHRDVISTKLVELDKQNRKFAAKFHESLREPEKLLHLVTAEMDELEDRFTKVSSSAVVIGDRLAIIDKEKNRARDTDELLEAILLLNTPSTAPVKSTNKLYNTLKDPHRVHEAIVIVGKLRDFADELTSPATKVAVQEIHRLNQALESSLLQGFDDAQDQELRGVASAHDLGTMRENAASLVAHGCKDIVADRFVWNVMKEKLTKHAQFLRADSSTTELDHPDAPTCDECLQDLDSLVAKIRAICKSQFVVIQSVFSAAIAPSIREILVERLCHDPAFGLLSHLERLLGRDGMADKEYVAALRAAYEKCCGLVQAIGMLPLETPAETDRMQTFLTAQLQVLFGGHRQRYVQIEQDLLHQSLDQTLGLIKWPAIPSGKNKYKLKDQAARESTT
ncbi:hypothetical protein DYB32_008400, partial [Aphanomyces invadans]